MDVRRGSLGLALAALFLVLQAPAQLVRAQTQVPPAAPTPPTFTIPAAAVPRVPSEQSAAVIRPLVEIGRVRARTPYCAALANARPGIDAAITYEYQIPVVAADLRRFRFDSGLHHHQSLKQTERDLNALWDLAQSGRNEVLALRTAALSPDLDDAKRREMLALANAVDGAKARQKELAKSLARVVAVYAETPVRTIVTSSKDESATSNAFAGRTRFAMGPMSPTDVSSMAPITQSEIDALDQHGRSQDLFAAFTPEQFIRDDMEVAASHAKAAMQLGGCSP
ncbi:MAG TPA: hypothetical protein VFF00_10420 [Candidatus Elarobacter sp.]|nr:hypothetical protein [Dongiaceae bacterium]HZW54443.1 hypothetical protein [Candidatus Elarobacter sp.]